MNPITRRTLFARSFAACLTLPAWAEAAEKKADHVPSLAYKWLDVALEATANEVDRNGARPTIISRTVAIFATGMFDAWAAYDEKAVGSRLGGTLRRPAAERTAAAKEKAISHAAYRTLLYVYPEDEAYLTARMREFGHDPADTSEDPATPQGIGNRAAAAVIAHRRHDGANQHGDEPGTPGGKAYADYTYYTPVNPPDRIIDPDRWQPIPFSNGKGGTVTPGFLTPHWYRVTPFGLKTPDQFRPPGPPKMGSEQLRKEAEECLRENASLTPEKKAVVEFMRDGPRSTGQSGHWLRFAQLVSKRDRHGLDEDVKLYFAVANAAMDAFIASWEAKRFYDSSRPWTLIHHYFAGQEVEAWGGPGKGTIKMKGEDWHPYSPAVFVTPPFPGYISGHACVSAAAARTLELFTGSDHFGEKEIRPCCVLTENEPGETVTLDLPTFSAAAEMAAVSRMLGGYHIRTDNEHGLTTGRKVADHVWTVIKAHFDGTLPAQVVHAPSAAGK